MHVAVDPDVAGFVVRGAASGQQAVQTEQPTSPLRNVLNTTRMCVGHTHSGSVEIRGNCYFFFALIGIYPAPASTHFRSKTASS